MLKNFEDSWKPLKKLKSYLVLSCSEKVEKSDDRTLKLCATTSVDSGRWEGLPHNGLTDVGGNEEGDTRAKSIALKCT